MAIWSGSLTANDVLDVNASDAILEIGVALDAVNATDATTANNDLALLGIMVKERQGVPGTYDVFKDFQALFQDDSEYLDAEEFKEEYAKWSFNRRGYAIKNGSFDKKTFKDAKERRIDIEGVVTDRTMSILATYNNIYKPNVIFETIMTVPTSGGGFYEKFGFVRNVPVKKSKLIDYDSTAADGASGSLVRNNWRTIAANTGITLADIQFYKQYFGEIEGIDEENLVVYGNSSSLLAIKNLYSTYSQEYQEITANGMPTGVQGIHIDGMTLVVTKSLPKNTLLILNPDSNMLITKLVSELPEFRGVAIETIKDDDKLISNVQALQGAKIVIQEEGLTNTLYC